MKIGPPPDYEGMNVGSYTLPPSEVVRVHPDAKAGEFYASCQNRRKQDVHWSLGPFDSREEARSAICAAALERQDDGLLGTVEIIDERVYRMSDAGRTILTAIQLLSKQDAWECFEWALEQKEKSFDSTAIRQDKSHRH